MISISRSLTSALTVQINNQVCFFSESVTIFQACLIKHIFIPRFCYHIALKIAGNCRMCLVEEKSSVKPVASCAVTISSGMLVHTHTEIIKKAREGVLEYLLINHPLDCPICDQGGECDLQDQTMVFGADRGRFYEYKRSTPNKNFGFLIKTFLNRCIHCARCTRFLADIAGTGELELLGRGYNTEIGTYTNKLLNSEISGNIIDLCPVGALTSKLYAYKARPWELISVYTFDIMDAFGSSVQLDFRGLELMRVLPKIFRELNEEWITDKTRFYYDALKLQRLNNPYVKKKAVFKSISWLSSLLYLKNNYLQNLIQLSEFTIGQNLITTKFGPFLDYETIISYKSFLGMFGATNFLQNSFNLDIVDFREKYGFCSLLDLDNTIESNLNKLNIVILGVNLRFETPILNLKIRRLVNENFAQLGVVGFIANFNFSYNHYSVYLCKIILKKIKSLNTKTIIILNDQALLLYSKLLYSLTSSKITLNTIYSTIGEITIKEVVLKNSYLNTILNTINFNFGLSELKNLNINPLDIYLLHHIENNFFENKELQSKILLVPTKFYFEKASNFISNVFLRFNTAVSHFRFSLINTREEWQILFASLEFFGLLNFKDKKKAEEFLITKLINYIPHSSGLQKNFFIVKKNEFSTVFFLYSTTLKSRINNFYNTNIVTRLSPVLSLCSKKLTILNDYLFVIKINV